jgi:uncharacterized membrane protein YfcA
MHQVLIVIIVAIAAIIKGITGFGFALIALPLLMFWYTPKEIIPVLVLCNLVASIFIVLQKKDRKLVNTQFQVLIFYGAAFTSIGVLALHYISNQALIIIMSAFFIVLSTLSLIGINYPIKQNSFTYKLAGAFCGFLTGCISVSGPPLALFLNAAKVNKQEFREIFSWFSIVTASIAIGGYWVLGLLTINILKMTFLFLPILFLGSWAGKKLNESIPISLFSKISIIMSLASSIFLLFKLK